LAALVVTHPLSITAQTEAVPAVSEPSTIRWWHGAILLGGLSGLMLLDEPVQRFAQDNRTRTGNGLANTLRHFGQFEVYGTVTLGLLGTGVLSGNHEITRAGGRLAATLVVAGAAANAAKLTLGRYRPHEHYDSDSYVLFSGKEAMPSGHTAMAFALATALADDIQRPWASVGLYTIATGVAWSRMNDDRHWLSDVAAGAALGIASAKIINGRWRLLNLRPPEILLGPRHGSLAWRLDF
jgi:membrane-associated phospholipid phosphatase